MRIRQRNRLHFLIDLFNRVPRTGCHIKRSQNKLYDSPIVLVGLASLYVRCKFWLITSARIQESKLRNSSFFLLDSPAERSLLSAALCSSDHSDPIGLQELKRSEFDSDRQHLGCCSRRWLGCEPVPVSCVSAL